MHWNLMKDEEFGSFVASSMGNQSVLQIFTWWMDDSQRIRDVLFEEKKSIV